MPHRVTGSRTRSQSSSDAAGVGPLTQLRLVGLRFKLRSSIENNTVPIAVGDVEASRLAVAVGGEERGGRVVDGDERGGRPRTACRRHWDVRRPSSK